MIRLFVYGEYPERSADYKLNRSPQNIKLYLPANNDIHALNSNINVKGNNNQEMKDIPII